jgi:hypothetical protein
MDSEYLQVELALSAHGRCASLWHNHNLFELHLDYELLSSSTTANNRYTVTELRKQVHGDGQRVYGDGRRWMADAQ